MAELERSSKASSKKKDKKPKLVQMPSFSPDPQINVELSQTKKQKENDEDIFLKNPQFSLLSPMDEFKGIERSNSKFDHDDELLQSTPRS